jgi:hypothetical protein
LVVADKGGDLHDRRSDRYEGDVAVSANPTPPRASSPLVAMTLVMSVTVAPGASADL